MATAGEVGGHQRCRWCFCGWLFGRLGQGKGHGGAFSGKLVGYRRVKGSCGLLVGVSWSFFGDFGSFFFFGDMTYDLHLMLQTGGLETISLVDTSSVRSQWDLAFQSVILLHFTYISIAFIQDKISSWESTYISLIQGTFVSMIFSFPQMGYVSPLQGIHPSTSPHHWRSPNGCWGLLQGGNILSFRGDPTFRTVPFLSNLFNANRFPSLATNKMNSRYFIF